MQFAKQFASKKDVLTTYSQESKSITIEDNIMGRKEKVRTTTIVLGDRSNPTRLLVEQYEKVRGKQKLSEMIRKAIFVYLADRPELKGWKEKSLKYEKLLLAEELQELSRRSQELHKKADEMGIDLDE